MPPSGLSLLGLIRHAAKAERLWFRQRVGGEDLPRLYPVGEADIHAATAASAEAARRVQHHTPPFGLRLLISPAGPQSPGLSLGLVQIADRET